jgi:hypothetical protein
LAKSKHSPKLASSLRVSLDSHAVFLSQQIQRERQPSATLKAKKGKRKSNYVFIFKKKEKKTI